MLTTWVSFIYPLKFIFAERVFGVRGKIQHVSLRKGIRLPFQDPKTTIWEEDNVCPDLPESCGDPPKSTSHSWALMLTLGPAHPQMCENACTAANSLAASDLKPPHQQLLQPRARRRFHSEHTVFKLVSGQRNSMQGLNWLKIKRSLLYSTCQSQVSSDSADSLPT